MIKQLKLGLQMLRYAFGSKTCAVMGVIFLTIGILLKFLPINASAMGATGVLFISINGMWTMQLVSSLGVSSMVRSSHWAKAMETSIPTLVGFVSFLATYLLIFCLNLPYLSNAGEEKMEIMMGKMILAGTLSFILMVYSGIAYKFFVVGSILFLAVFYLGGLNMPFTFISGLSLSINFGQATLIGFLEIVLGALAQYGISCLLYKRPLTKNAQMRQLQKSMV